MVSEHDGAIEHSTRNPVSTFLRKTFYVGHDTQRVSNAAHVGLRSEGFRTRGPHSPDRAGDEESAARNSTFLRRGGRRSRWSSDLTT